MVRANEQASSSDISAEDLISKIKQKLLSHGLFQAAVRPKTFGPVLLNRYRGGMAYGAHVDDALMGGTRTDVSFTLFIDAPETYEGGELIIEGASGELSYKLPAGSALTYASTSLHRVNPVTHGERRAIVGWVQSYVRSAERRELLFDLERARLAVFDRCGKGEEFDLLSKTLSNLIRMWVDP